MTNKGLIIAAFIIAMGLIASSAIEHSGTVENVKAAITDILPFKQ